MSNIARVYIYNDLDLTIKYHKKPKSIFSFILNHVFPRNNKV